MRSSQRYKKEVSEMQSGQLVSDLPCVTEGWLHQDQTTFVACCLIPPTVLVTVGAIFMLFSCTPVSYLCIPEEKNMRVM